MVEKKSKEKSSQKDSNYIETVRDGAIAANIFRGQSNDGFSYHYFKLSRAWKSTKQNSEGYSDRFFSRNAEALGQVADRAANRCEELDGTLEGRPAEPQIKAAA